MALPKLSRIRKALIAAVPPLLPILAYFLGVMPQAHQLIGPLVYVAILGELGAIGVYAITNEPAPALVPEDLPAKPEPGVPNLNAVRNEVPYINAVATPNAKFIDG